MLCLWEIIRWRALSGYEEQDDGQDERNESSGHRA